MVGVVGFYQDGTGYIEIKRERDTEKEIKESR